MKAFILSIFRIWYIPLLMFALLLGCVHDESNDIEEIRKISKARAEAFNKGDAEGIAIHFTADAILIPPGKPSMSGRKAIELYYQSIFNEYLTELTSEYKEVDLEGDLAYGRGYAKVKLISKSGDDTIYSESEYINILKRQADGNWKTTHDIWNSSK